MSVRVIDFWHFVVRGILPRQVLDVSFTRDAKLGRAKLARDMFFFFSAELTSDISMQFLQPQDRKTQAELSTHQSVETNAQLNVRVTSKQLINIIKHSATKQAARSV